MIVYVITCKSGKSYVGVTGDLVKRLSLHKKADSFIGRALRKHEYEIKTVFEGTVDECFTEEVKLIRRLRTKWPNGYNLTDGGEGVVGETEEVRQARSSAMKRIMSDPIRKSKARGAVWTPEMRARKAEQTRAQWAKWRDNR